MTSIAMIIGTIVLVVSAGIIVYDFFKVLYKYFIKHKNKQQKI